MAAISPVRGSETSLLASATSEGSVDSRNDVCCCGCCCCGCLGSAALIGGFSIKGGGLPKARALFSVENLPAGVAYCSGPGLRLARPSGVSGGLPSGVTGSTRRANGLSKATSIKAGELIGGVLHVLAYDDNVLGGAWRRLSINSSPNANALLY